MQISNFFVPPTYIRNAHFKLAYFSRAKKNGVPFSRTIIQILASVCMIEWYLTCNVNTHTHTRFEFILYFFPRRNILPKRVVFGL